MAGTDSKSAPYLLYYHPYSVCSLMVLFTLALKGTATSLENEIDVEAKVLDIFHQKQLDEEYLCNINKYGQVPVLVHEKALAAPINDSLDITFWLASKYPDLMPAAFESEIRQYLTALHKINYFSLSFPGRPHVAKSFEDAIQARLSNPDISDQYRKALEFKLAVVKLDKTGGLVPSVTAENETKTKTLLEDLKNRLPGPQTWMFGSNPTALDAHLVVFLARMTDVGREYLIPPELRAYAAWAWQQPEWVAMMGGRKTMISR